MLHQAKRRLGLFSVWVSSYVNGGSPYLLVGDGEQADRGWDWSQFGLARGFCVLRDADTRVERAVPSATS